MIGRISAVSCALATTLLAAPDVQAAAAPEYEVTLIAPPVPMTFIEGLKVNNRGHVYVVTGDDFGTTRNLIWTGGDAYLTVATPDGSLVESVGGLNDHDALVGRSQAAAFYWSEQTGPLAIDPPEGYERVQPADINNKGVVVGSIYPVGSDVPRSFTWTQKGGIVVYSSGEGSTASSISTNGLIAGNLFSKRGASVAGVWNKDSIVLIGMYNRSQTQSVGVNAKGTVALNSFDGQFPFGYAFIWTEKGGMRKISEGRRAAIQINSANQVLTTQGSNFYYLWDKDFGEIPVTSMLVPGSPVFSAFDVHDMSDSGILAGECVSSGTQAAVIFTPIRD